jgi:hypothetical protein
VQGVSKTLYFYFHGQLTVLHSTTVGGLIFVLAIVVVPQDYKKDRKGDRSVDWFGAFIVTSGLVLLTFALADAKRASKGVSLKPPLFQNSSTAS